MKFRRKSGVESKISTSSMPDIIFMLLIFFMVTTVLREFSGLPVSLPKAERIEKLESKKVYELQLRGSGPFSLVKMVELFGKTRFTMQPVDSSDLIKKSFAACL